MFNIGDIVEGEITKITNFGAFVKLSDGKVGLVHISEIANKFVKDIKEIYQENDKVKVKILSYNENNKISLSIKKADPIGQTVEKVEKNEKVQEVSKSKPEKSERRPEKVTMQFESFKNNNYSGKPKLSFEEKIQKFLKDSEDKIQELKRREEGPGYKKKKNNKTKR